jgi:2,4-dienoyl-CoA reductase-like NADH-dependent reductase (Old Yellow Enzyme family)
MMPEGRANPNQIMLNETTNDGIKEIIKAYIKTAKLAYEIGFDIVDLKHCHDYLGHEFLTTYGRDGEYE